MIEEPSSEQKRVAVICDAARMLADGRKMETVLLELRKRGLSADEIDELQREISQQFVEFIRLRRRRLCLEGSLWLLVGLVIPSGLVWFYGFFSMWLVIAAVPTWYGFYLLALPPTKEPRIKPPALFGRNL